VSFGTDAWAATTDVVEGSHLSHRPVESFGGAGTDRSDAMQLARSNKKNSRAFSAGVASGAVHPVGHAGPGVSLVDAWKSA
jgi:hypothetical protein